MENNHRGKKMTNEIIETITQGIPILLIITIPIILVIGAVKIFTGQYPPLITVIIGGIIAIAIGYGTRNDGKQANWDFMGRMFGTTRRRR